MQNLAYFSKFTFLQNLSKYRVYFFCMLAKPGWYLFKIITKNTYTKATEKKTIAEKKQQQ